MKALLDRAIASYSLRFEIAVMSLKAGILISKKQPIAGGGSRFSFRTAVASKGLRSCRRNLADCADYGQLLDLDAIALLCWTYSDKQGKMWAVSGDAPQLADDLMQGASPAPGMSRIVE